MPEEGNKFAIIHIKKMKNEGLAKIAEHCRRTSPDGKYSNCNVDPERRHLNIRRSDYPETEKLKTLIDRRIAEREVQKTKVKKNAVKLISVVVQTSPDQMNSLPREEQIRYFDEAFKFCQKLFGKENVIEMNCHFDETTPHAHIAVVPIIKGKLCAKDLINKKFLFDLQKNFPEAMRAKGFNVKRGKGGDPKERRKHLSEEEYRLQAWASDLEKSEVNLKKFEKRIEDDFASLEVPRQTLQDAQQAPQLSLEVSETLFSDKKVKVNREELEKVWSTAELSKNLLAKIGTEQLRERRQQEELDRLREESEKQKMLADHRGERLRELDNKYSLILRENGHLRDENTLMKEYIIKRGFSEDFEDWAGALREAEVSLEIHQEKFI